MTDKNRGGKHAAKLKRGGKYSFKLKKTEEVSIQLNYKLIKTVRYTLQRTFRVGLMVFEIMRKNLEVTLCADQVRNEYVYIEEMFKFLVKIISNVWKK